MGVNQWQLLLTKKNVMGVTFLHEEGLHGKGPSSSWLYGGMVYAIRHFLPHGFLKRVLSSSSQASLLYKQSTQLSRWHLVGTTSNVMTLACTPLRTTKTRSQYGHPPSNLAIKNASASDHQLHTSVTTTTVVYQQVRQLVA